MPLPGTLVPLPGDLDIVEFEALNVIISDPLESMRGDGLTIAANL